MTVENTAEQALRRFRETVDAWAPYIEWASITAVGVKSPEALSLISGRVQLFRADVDRTADLQVETEHIFGRRQFVACSGQGGARRVEDAIHGRLKFENPDSTLELRAAGLSLAPFPIRPLGATADFRLPTCRATGDRKFAALEPIGGLETVDWELRANEPPYHGLDDLMISLGLPTHNAMGDLAQLEVQTVPPAIILPEPSAIHGGRAEVFIWGSPGLRAEDVSVSVKGFSRAGVGVNARALDYEATLRLEGRSYDVMKFAGDMGNDIAVRVFLRVKGLAIHQHWIDDPSRRLYAALVGAEVFDPSLSALDQYLFNSPNDQAERFEWAVGNLLYLLGFRILRLGKGTPVTDGPDLLALTPSGHLAVVECTLGHPDNKDKVAKVLQRAARVREKLSKSGFSESNVLPVVATPMPRDELRDAHADCLRRGALLVDKETLADLRQRAKFPQNADQILGEGTSVLSSRDSTQG